MAYDTLSPVREKIKKMKINARGRFLDEDGEEITTIDTAKHTLMMQSEERPMLLCFKVGDVHKRFEVLPLYLGPEGSEFEYRIVYEDDPKYARELIAQGRSPFEGLSCEDVWAVSSEKFSGHKFGQHTPTGGGEGGGTVGGGS